MHTFWQTKWFKKYKIKIISDRHPIPFLWKKASYTLIKIINNLLKILNVMCNKNRLVNWFKYVLW